MEVTLDPRVPLFAHLARLAESVERRGRDLRLVGGAAMLLWGRHLSRARDMTEDLDVALLSHEFPDDAAAKRVARDVLEDLRELGFSRAADWQASRKGRFSYLHRADPVAVDLLCGTVPVGRRSRREPAWRLAAVSSGPPNFYAARVPWLDLVADWVLVRVRCGPSTFHARTPDLAGLALLKIRAVADKMARVSEEQGRAGLEYERLRLQRHARDCICLFGWIDERGEFDRLARLSRQHADVCEVARAAAGWTLDHREIREELRLAPLQALLARLVPAGR